MAYKKTSVVKAIERTNLPNLVIRDWSIKSLSSSLTKTPSSLVLQQTLFLLEPAVDIACVHLKAAL